MLFAAGAVAPCRLLASFLTPASTVPQAQNTFSLLPGQSAALEFSGVALAAATRQTILPAVRQLSGNITCLGVTANVELYDRLSARTFAFTPPQPVLPTDR